MRYHHLTDNCMATAIGEGGLSDEVFTGVLMEAAPAHDRLIQLYESGELPCLAVAARDADLTAIHALAGDWRARLTDVVVLGTGGSSLGGQTLCALAGSAAPRVHFLDNVDPETIEALLGALDLKRTGVIAISKSGSTSETLAQTLILLPALEAAVGRGKLAGHAAVVTEARDSPLKQIAARYDLPCVDHDPGIGGRFSALSAVGLLPAAIAGLDVAALRGGANEVLQATLGAEKVEDSGPAVGAAIAVGLLREHGIAQSVFMTYEDRLAHLGLWYRQLWAESLGKDGTGTTPIHARGTADHHSQLQLYLAGPRDKMFTFVMPGCAGQGPKIDSGLAASTGMTGLAGRNLGDLMDASARAAAETLARNGRPVRLIRLDGLDGAALGAMLMHFMIETIIAADLLGVNAFDQPAVEEGKALTWQYLDEAGT